MVLFVSGCVVKGCTLEILNDNARLRLVFAVNALAGILSVKTATIYSEVIAMSVEDRVEDLGRVVCPGSGTAHDEQVGINVVVEDFVPD